VDWRDADQAQRRAGGPPRAEEPLLDAGSAGRFLQDEADALDGGWSAAGDAVASSRGGGGGGGWGAPRPRTRAGARRAAASSVWDGEEDADDEDEDEDTDADDDDGGVPPRADVSPLTRAEQQALLPFSATGAQYAYYWGAFDTALQRIFASLLGCLVTADASPLLAVPIGLYFLWAPPALAARRNAPLRRYPYAGLWHARVLRAETHAARTPGGITFDVMGDAFLPKRRTSSVRLGGRARALLPRAARI
jgi:hypothetical protein